MHARPSLALAGLAFLAAAGACSSGDSPTDNPLVDDQMTAMVDGDVWAATTIQSSRAGDVLTISGNDGTLNITIQIRATSTGVYDIGTDEVTVTISAGGEAWLAGQIAGSGQVGLNLLDGDDAVGRFSVDAAPAPGSGASSELRVTDGSFAVGY